MIKINLLSPKVPNKPLAPGVERSQGGNFSQEVASSASAKFDGDLFSDSSQGEFEFSLAGQVVKVALIGGFVILLLLFQKYQESQGAAKIRVVRTELDTLKGIISQKKEQTSSKQNIEESAKNIKESLSKLRSIKYYRTVNVLTLDVIQTSLPRDLWLKQVKFDGSNFSLTGQSLEESDLDEFVQNLKITNLFSGVSIPRDVDVTAESEKIINEFDVLLTLENIEKYANGDKE